MDLSVWDAYAERISQAGTLRDALVEQAKDAISHMVYDSPSCHRILVDGVEQSAMITHRARINEKRISSLPREHLKHGGLVDFADSKWLITELDADNEIYDRGVMIRCNYLARWIGRDGTLKEKWCVVEDGTKLKRYMRNGLACWKRYVKTISLYAGTPLELCYRNGEMKYAHTAMV